jgi:hypothetical protein
LAVTIFKFNERHILVKKDDFLKYFGYCSAPVKMQIYKHRHHQWYSLFFDYLISNKRFDNILLRFLNQYDESTNTTFYEDMMRGITHSSTKIHIHDAFFVDLVQFDMPSLETVDLNIDDQTLGVT